MIAFDLGLLSYTDRYLLSRDVSKGYATTLRARIEAFCGWAGADIPVRSLDCQIANEWLAELAAREMSAWSIRGYRGALLTVWRDAYESGATDNPPFRLRRVRRPALLVEAYTHTEIRRLLAAAARLKSRHNDGNQAADFWRAAIHVGYSCGPRRGDLLRIEWRHVARGGLLTFVQHKTRFPHTVKLSSDALKYCRRLKTNGLLLPWPYQPDWFSRVFKRLRIAAGLTRGSFRWIRRSAGSYAERMSPGAGAKLLGHRDPAVFDRYYRDRSITDVVPVAPPPLR